MEVTKKSPGSKETEEKEYDIYKDSLLRYLGYANEVGEAFRSVVPLSFVRLSYVVSSMYVVCDATDKGYKSWQRPISNGKKYKATAAAFTDTLIWQAFASVAIPGFTINRICWLTGLCLRRVTRLPIPVQRWSVVAVGLGSIPFIVHPIDHGVHFVMDRSVRKLYFDKSDS